MKKFLSTPLLYSLMISFVMGWWTLAFRANSSHMLDTSELETPALTLNTADLLPYLSPIQRESLRQALAGDIPLMLDFIASWDRDAQILTEKGVNGIQRLSSDAYLQAHLIARLIQESPSDKLQELNCRLRLKSMRDDAGHIIQLEDSFTRFLPQTYVAASFLLAIAKPQELTAIPKGLRELPQLYPSEALERIPSHIDCYQAEKLYLTQPHLAFVAHYTHPPMLEMLRNQGIKLYTIKNIDTLADIQETLLKIGHASNHPLEANLLALFIQASLLAIDNRFRALEELIYQPDSFKTVLYLYYHQNYMMPTDKCLTGQLLQRAFALHKGLSCPIPSSQHEWRIPFEQEKILNSNPDCLILSLPPSVSGFKNWIAHHKMFQELPAFHSRRIFYVDEAVQESPTQYIVLAYFDLFQALASAHYL
ncbi:ABC transporter substrate-binding protein [Candidatus Protochlamydia phocaeensis]|uniref:ABC transporter substrate-binding protein n=1 Tax=Candidatus Protochlamydia phocaeensis TaxID=1414722 RepID=UPI000838CC5D|nr:ABC transporter substrate-binding protein [Candidatus Protochlamydia phocaeensis]